MLNVNTLNDISELNYSKEVIFRQIQLKCPESLKQFFNYI